MRDELVFFWTNIIDKCCPERNEIIQDLVSLNCSKNGMCSRCQSKNKRVYGGLIFQLGNPTFKALVTNGIFSLQVKQHAENK